MTPDDKNKYIILGRPIQDQVDAENIRDVGEYNQKVASLVEIQSANKSILPHVIGNASVKNISNLNGKVLEFMNSNLDFWNFTSRALLEINDLSNLLQMSVQAGKLTAAK